MSAHEENLYTSWLEDDRSEKRGLRWSLAVAVVLHGTLLAVAVPNYSAEVVGPAAQDKVFLVPTPRFKKPPTPPTDTSPPVVTRIPIPDPDPLAPEPFVSDDELAPAPVIADVDDTAFFTFPQAPPAPAPEKLVYRVGEVEPPERIRYVEPRYTELARKVRVEGHVILQATIDARGDVVDVQALKGLSMGLTEAAVAAVEQWKFRPSAVDGRPVSVLYILTVNFQLR